ncbi:unnamed protein product, partial [Tilletia controversa]
MPAFRMFAATLIAAVNLLTLVNFLNVPASVFSTNDLKGADTRSIKNIYTFGDSYTGLNCTRHRVFLATLIVAAKYLNDSSPKNKHWTRYGVLFSLPEVNLMEKQLLYLLDYDLRIEESELMVHFRPFLVPDRQEVRGARLMFVKGTESGREEAKYRRASERRVMMRNAQHWNGIQTAAPARCDLHHTQAPLSPVSPAFVGPQSSCNCSEASPSAPAAASA